MQKFICLDDSIFVTQLRKNALNDYDKIWHPGPGTGHWIILFQKTWCSHRIHQILVLLVIEYNKN